MTKNIFIMIYYQYRNLYRYCFQNLHLEKSNGIYSVFIFPCIMSTKLKTMCAYQIPDKLHHCLHCLGQISLVGPIYLVLLQCQLNVFHLFAGWSSPTRPRSAQLEVYKVTCGWLNSVRKACLVVLNSGLEHNYKYFHVTSSVALKSKFNPIMYQVVHWWIMSYHLNGKQIWDL